MQEELTIDTLSDHHQNHGTSILVKDKYSSKYLTMWYFLFVCGSHLFVSDHEASIIYGLHGIALYADGVAINGFRLDLFMYIVYTVNRNGVIFSIIGGIYTVNPIWTKGLMWIRGIKPIMETFM